VYAADGTAAPISGTTGLTATTNYAANVGPDSVAFYADVEDAAVTAG
jgi:xanthine/uracil permease